MKIKEIILLTMLSLLVGCTTTPQEKTLKLEQKSIISETPEGFEKLTINATGSTYFAVHALDTKERLYRNTLHKGGSETIEISRPSYVLVSSGENVILEWKGKEFKPSSEGPTRIALN